MRRASSAGARSRRRPRSTIAGAAFLGMIDFTVPLDLDRRLGTAAATIGLLFAAAACLDAIASPIAGSARRSPRAAARSCITGAAGGRDLGHAASPRSPGSAGAAVALIVFGVGQSIVFAGAVPWLDETFGELDRGLAYGGLNLVFADRLHDRAADRRLAARVGERRRRLPADGLGGACWSRFPGSSQGRMIRKLCAFLGGTLSPSSLFANTPRPQRPREPPRVTPVHVDLESPPSPLHARPAARRSVPRLRLAGGPSLLPGPESALAAECPGGDTPPRKVTQRRAAKAVLCLVNKQRAKRGNGRLDHQGDLDDAANSHTARMQRSNCFDHVCPGEPSLTGATSATTTCRADAAGAPARTSPGAAAAGAPPQDRQVLDAEPSAPQGDPRALLRAHRRRGPLGLAEAQAAKAGTYTLDFGYKR